MIGLAAGVQVRVAQKQERLGPAKYPGRVGTIERRHPYEEAHNGGLWYVRLHATKRGKERVETFWGKELEVAEGA